MFLTLRIWWLKRRLRRQILSFNRDYIDYRCGSKMMGIITGGVYARRQLKIEETKAKLRAIDPNFPKAKT